MTITPSALAKKLLSENRSGRSWRKISREGYSGKVNHATLCRIAKSDGAWLPKDRKILKILGLIEPKKRTEIEKQISRMARKTKKAVLIR